ncbi:hypothetical protein LEL_08832 [Akanthomyces lecanii RCEF 1005]|uniref:VWFA domain-containing protein n=1 Tax=Akanthomyces lecanii RCEF 1005 TaxID=1081108 RepID=A0A168DV77_CORDF|nr:hypothetical protein LEL_08832 [Akanthomyces lecanii RCEF 1005]
MAPTRPSRRSESMPWCNNYSTRDRTMTPGTAQSSRNPSHNPGVGPESISRANISQTDMQSLVQRVTRSSLNDGSSASLRRPTSSAADGQHIFNRQASGTSTVPPSAEGAHHETNRQRIETRLKRKGEATPFPHEAEARLVRIRNHENHALAKSKPASTAGIFKHISSTDLLFLIDTTRSMQPYISAAKDQVISIMKDIKSAFFNKADVRMAVLVAQGGGDYPEDVLGGLQQALVASWKHPTRCIIHICDAPAHGRNLHDLDDGDDDYIKPGSEPHGLTHVPMLKLLIEQNVHYSLLRINGSTDRVAYEFYQVYADASADCKLHKANTYHSLVGKTLSGPVTASLQGTAPGGRAENKLNFEEHNLVKIVTTSATRSVTLSVSVAGNGKDHHRGHHFSPLSMVEECDDPDVALETTAPQWDTPGWLDEVIEFLFLLYSIN